MAYKLIHKNILSVKVDAIVNPANSKPVCTPGNEMNLYDAAGAEDLLEARQNIGEIAIGEAAATPVFDLKVKHIIHTAVPIMNRDTKTKPIAALRKCYMYSLKLAAELKCNSVAMPIFLL